MARRFSLALLLGLALAAALSVLPASGHGGGLPWIYLEDEVIWPGQSFHVLVIDFGPNAEVTLEATMGELRVTLGTITCEGDGHGEGNVALPANFPLGYAELHALGDDGTEAMLPLLVGDRVPAIGPPGPVGQGPGSQGPGTGGGPTTAAAAWWQDPSVLVLAGVLGAAALALVYGLLQRRSSPSRGNSRARH